MNVLRSARLYLLALVAVAALVLTTGPTTSTRAARVVHLEQIVRCPACEVLSVGQSTKPASLAIRAEIARRVAAGATDQQILVSLEARYGPSVLLTPATTGVGVVLWAVPLGLVLGAVVSAVVVIRRSR